MGDWCVPQDFLCASVLCDVVAWCSLALVRQRRTAAWDVLFQMVMWCLCYKGTAKRIPLQCGIPEMVRRLPGFVETCMLHFPTSRD